MNDIDRVIAKALAWARAYRGNFNALDLKSYRIGYAALRRLFADYVRHDDYLAVVAGATAVYGWMPTIIRGVDETKWGAAKDTLAAVTSAKSWDAAKKALTSRRATLQLINGSVVGTSKFLHFLNPAVMPIWDSNIGSAFGIKSRYNIAKPDTYLKYGDLLHSRLASDITYPPAFREFVGRDVSTLRELEFLLFFYGRSLRGSLSDVDLLE